MKIIRKLLGFFYRDLSAGHVTSFCMWLACWSVRVVALFYGRESTELVSIWFVFQFYFALYLHVLYFYFSFHRLSWRNLCLSPSEAVKRPFGYLLIDLKTSTQASCQLRTNVLPSEQGFNQARFQENIPQELLKYLKQQTLSPVPLLPAMQEIIATWMMCFLETIFGTMRKLSDIFSCKTDTLLLNNT